MPGSSLWLVPPPKHPLHKVLSDLITEILPAQFPHETGPTFSPHMTLTSYIDPAIYGDEPQRWLDSIPWPAAEDVPVRFSGGVMSQDVFFRRGYIPVEFDGVRNVAGLARARGVNGEEGIGRKTEEWLKEWRSAFGPHVSLIYGESIIDGPKLKEIDKTVKDALQSIGTSEPGQCWVGGVVWLVPTDKPVAEWKPIATKAFKTREKYDGRASPTSPVCYANY